MFINWKSRELEIKVVYYGPPLSGKTTNLEQLHDRLPQNRRSDLISVKTREDRTLFFDFMQLQIGEIKGLKPKFKLYTVPGQVYYAATRKLVLQDVDGIVFVADSSRQQMLANRRSLIDMLQHLKGLERSPTEIPFVLQCNKQDLTDALPVATISQFLKAKHAPAVGAVAVEGKGINETLKTIITQVVERL